MVYGIDFDTSEYAGMMVKECFRNGMIIESCGSDDHVLKTLCPLTISEAEIERGVAIIARAALKVMNEPVCATVEA